MGITDADVCSHYLYLHMPQKQDCMEMDLFILLVLAYASFHMKRVNGDKFSGSSLTSLDKEGRSSQIVEEGALAEDSPVAALV